MNKINFIVGDTYIIDKEFNNSGEVILVCIYGKFFCRVKDPYSGDEWDTMIYRLSELNKDNKIKDLMIIARTDNKKLGKYDLPQNVFNYVSVDTKYEATVFMRFATDMLFDEMEHIAVKDYHDYIMNLHNEEKENKED